MSFFRCDDSGRINKLSRQQSNQIVSSSESLLDGARPLAPVQYPSLPFLSSTNNTSTYSYSTLTTGISNKRYVPLKDSIPSCPRVYLFLHFQTATFTGMNNHRAQLVKLISILVNPILKQVSTIQTFQRVI